MNIIKRRPHIIIFNIKKTLIFICFVFYDRYTNTYKLHSMNKKKKFNHVPDFYRFSCRLSFILAQQHNQRGLLLLFFFLKHLNKLLGSFKLKAFIFCVIFKKKFFSYRKKKNEKSTKKIQLFFRL